MEIGKKEKWQLPLLFFAERLSSEGQPNKKGSLQRSSLSSFLNAQRKPQQNLEQIAINIQR